MSTANPKKRPLLSVPGGQPVLKKQKLALPEKAAKESADVDKENVPVEEDSLSVPPAESVTKPDPVKKTAGATVKLQVPGKKKGGLLVPAKRGANVPSSKPAGGAAGKSQAQAGKSKAKGKGKKKKDEDEEEEEGAGGGGEEKKQKKEKKAPKAPRPKSAFQLWEAENKAAVKARDDNSGKSAGELKQVMKDEWEELSAEKKKPYVSREERAKLEYELLNPPKKGGKPPVKKGFHLFKEANEATERARNPNASELDLTKMLLAQWNRLSESERAKWDQRAREQQPPVKPNGAYVMYGLEMRQELKEKGLSAKEIMKEVAALWKALDPTAQQVYKDKAQTAAAEYKQQLSAYYIAHPEYKAEVDRLDAQKKAARKEKQAAKKEKEQQEGGGGKAKGKGKEKGKGGKGKAKKKAKDPNEPKRPQTAYFLWSNAKRPQLKAMEEHKTKTSPELAKVLGALWKEITAEEKKSFEEQARAAKAQYDIDIKQYRADHPQTMDDSKDGEANEGEGAEEEEEGTKKKAKKPRKKKHPNEPKRPQSAYFLWSNAKRPQLKAMEEHKTKKLPELAKVLGALWKDVTAEEKQPFEEQARAAKAQYDIDIKQYRADHPEPAMDESADGAGGSGEEEEEEGTKKKARKPRKKKDPNEPKRPQSAYFLWSNAKRPQLKAMEEHKTKKLPELAKVLGALWKDVTAEEKKPFEEQARAAKAQYDIDIKQYRADHPPVMETDEAVVLAEEVEGEEAAAEGEAQQEAQPAEGEAAEAEGEGQSAEEPQEQQPQQEEAVPALESVAPATTEAAVAEDDEETRSEPLPMDE